MFNVDDFVIIIDSFSFYYKDKFIIDRIKSINDDVITFVNSDFNVSLEKSAPWKILSYEEGLPLIMKSKTITKINNCLKDLSVDYGDYEYISEEELNELLLKVQSLEEDIKNVNKRYLIKHKE